MAAEYLRRHWSEIRADVPRYWGKLTPADLDRVAGQFGSFVDVLRQRYGFSQVKAEDELDRYLAHFNWPPRAS